MLYLLGELDVVPLADEAQVGLTGTGAGLLSPLHWRDSWCQLVVCSSGCFVVKYYTIVSSRLALAD